MRSKTLVLGWFLCMVALTLISGKSIKTMPNIKQHGEESQSSIIVADDNQSGLIDSNDTTTIILWSKSDAVSRIVNSWLSRQGDTQKLLSICIDAPITEAKSLARLDGVSSSTKILGSIDSEDILQELDLSSTPKILKVYGSTIISSYKIKDYWLELLEEPNR